MDTADLKGDNIGPKFGLQTHLFKHLNP